jgi:hypothetical protein
LRTAATDAATSRPDHYRPRDALRDFLLNQLGDVAKTCGVVRVLTGTEAADPAALHVPIEVAHC